MSEASNEIIYTTFSVTLCLLKKKKISFPSKRFQNRQNSEPANSILRMMNGNRSETLIHHFQALRSSNTLQKKKSICQTRR